jgi:hypothetical protein
VVRCLGDCKILTLHSAIERSNKGYNDYIMQTPDHSASQENIDLKSLDVSQVIKLIKEYNQQHNWGTVTGEHLNAAMDKEYLPGASLSIEDIEDKVNFILNSIGLGLESVDGGMTLLTDHKERIPTSEMRINLVDGKKFITYLNTLDSQSVTSSQIDGLKDVVHILEQQLINEYELDDPDDDRMIVLFGSLEEMINAFIRLDSTYNHGLSDSIKNLSDYLDMARGKYLKEYFLAKKEKLLEGVDSHNFGPAQWHRDSSAEDSFQTSWEYAFFQLEKIKENPKAEKLYRDIIHNLKTCITHAKGDIAAHPRDYNQTSKRASEFNKILDEAYKKLGDL